MRSFEQGGEHARPKVEIRGLPIEAPEVQVALALFAYGEAHHQSSTQPAHWEENDEAIQSAAMGEWIGDPDEGNSLAALSRAYIEEHPLAHININDPDALRNILTILRDKKRMH